MTTTPSDLVRPSEDPALRVPRELLAEAERLEAEWRARHAELPEWPKGVMDVDLDRLEDRRQGKRIQDAKRQAQHLIDVALGMAKTRYVTAREPGLLEHLRSVLSTVPSCARCTLKPACSRTALAQWAQLRSCGTKLTYTSEMRGGRCRVYRSRVLRRSGSSMRGIESTWPSVMTSVSLS